ncbi:MAG: hypothetical protein M3P85_01160, partial [Actinomycetota bacterium]|nr:hypothetical protein [Actinomycetota bacterium]
MTVQSHGEASFGGHLGVLRGAGQPRHPGTPRGACPFVRADAGCGRRWARSSWRRPASKPRSPGSPACAASHQDDQHRLRAKLAAAEARAAALAQRIAALQTAIGQRRDTRGDRFEMTVNGRLHRSRSEAGQHLQRLIGSMLASRHGPCEVQTGQLGGFELRAEFD